MVIDIVKRIVKKYQGKVIIKHSDKEFLVKIILYGSEQILHE